MGLSDESLRSPLFMARCPGVSVDYLVHLAFAYKHSLMHSRYYKSRAALLARAKSIGAAEITTLCSVMPLLGAQLQPLRQFGLIFTVVAGVPALSNHGHPHSMATTRDAFPATWPNFAPLLAYVHSRRPCAPSSEPSLLSGNGSNVGRVSDVSDVSDVSPPPRRSRFLLFLGRFLQRLTDGLRTPQDSR